MVVLYLTLVGQIAATSLPSVIRGTLVALASLVPQEVTLVTEELEELPLARHCCEGQWKHFSLTHTIADVHMLLT